MARQRNSFDNLPPFAMEYLQTMPAARATVQQFHQWLKASCRPIRQLDSSEVGQFLQRTTKAKPHDDARALRRLALTYFAWLHARGLLGFDPRCAWPRSNSLPPHVQRFLELLKPTHKLSTVQGYRTTLRQLHIWLDANHASIVDLDRSHVQGWLQWLHSRGLAASTRVNAIQHVRAYVQWLEEQRVLSASANTLFRRSDLPKLPKYLPRPVPPDIDIELQRRFKSSSCTYQLGLLLMRWTGLRIGELIGLPYRCTRTDPSGNSFLKVPLGKLDTERLVPLDRRAMRLISKLHRTGPRDRSLLLVTATGRKTRADRYRQAL